MSRPEMISHCCGAEIHYGHCTTCEKPCREEPRQPLASDAEAWTGKPKNRLLSIHDMMMGNMQAMDVADFYEAKLTTGELRVVQKCTYDDHCSICGNDSLETGGTIGGFCPGCGSQVESRGYLEREKPSSA